MRPSRNGFVPIKGEAMMKDNDNYGNAVHFIVDAIWSNSRAIKELGHEVRNLL
jgi:hypothetical protein